MMKHRGKIGGFIAANSIGIYEMFSLTQSISHISELKWSNVLIYFILVISQIILGIFLGHQMDKRYTQQLKQNAISPKELAYELFNKYNSLLERGQNKISVYCISIHNIDKLEKALTEQQIEHLFKTLESSISNTLRKSDSYFMWDYNRYIIIVSDNGTNTSKLLPRILKQIEKDTIDDFYRINLIYGGATSPQEGTTLDYLVEAATTKMYHMRDANAH